MLADQHLAGHLVQRQAGNAPGRTALVLGMLKGGAAEGRQVTAADPAGQGAQQHVTIRHIRLGEGGDLGLLESQGSDKPLCPHLVILRWVR
jgi:hypothetical protein